MYQNLKQSHPSYSFIILLSIFYTYKRHKLLIVDMKRRNKNVKRLKNNEMRHPIADDLSIATRLKIAFRRFQELSLCIASLLKLYYRWNHWWLGGTVCMRKIWQNNQKSFWFDVGIFMYNIFVICIYGVLCSPKTKKTTVKSVLLSPLFMYLSIE